MKCFHNSSTSRTLFSKQLQIQGFLSKRVLLGGVDPDNIQVAVIDALFILVGIAGAALRSRLCLCCLMQLQTRGSLGVRHAAGV